MHFQKNVPPIFLPSLPPIVRQIKILPNIVYFTQIISLSNFSQPIVCYKLPGVYVQHYLQQFFLSTECLVCILLDNQQTLAYFLRSEKSMHQVTSKAFWCTCLEPCSLTYLVNRCTRLTFWLFFQHTCTYYIPPINYYRVFVRNISRR